MTLVSSPLSERMTRPGQVSTLSLKTQYQPDPLALFEKLCPNKQHTLLLESAEIDDKAQLKSLLMSDAALRIEANGNTVTYTALTLNGQSLIPFIASVLPSDCRVSQSEQTLSVEFPAISQALDENSRLQADNALSALRLLTQIENLDHHPFAVFSGGCFAFDLINIAEQLPSVGDGENTCPDYVYYLAETLVVIDHQKRQSEIVANIFSGEYQEKVYFELNRRMGELNKQVTTSLPVTATDAINPLTSDEVNSQLKVNVSDDAFNGIVEQVKENIRNGDIFQVVPSRTFSLPCYDSIKAYAKLKQTNPSPYMFYLRTEDFVIFGASPESALKYDASNRQVELYPIAGTRRRGFNPDGSYNADLDGRIELDLRLDKKETAEHIMLVDLARNDIARIATPGSRYVAELLKVDRYSHVMHLVSRVVGTLRDEFDALHAYQACMNMGTLSGAPKVKATSIIRDVEQQRRGSYGGAVGYFTGEGDMDTCIVIRSAFVKNQTAYIQAGAGVVFDSVPQSESDETRQKAQAVISAVAATIEKEQINA